MPCCPFTTKNEDGTAGIEMHAWAADRMWEALIAVDDERWISAAENLAVAPMNAVPFDEMGAVGRPMVAIGEQLHRMANGARTVTGAERSKSYAAFLGNCGTCHQVSKNILAAQKGAQPAPK